MEQEATFIKHLQVCYNSESCRKRENAFYESSKTKLITKKEVKGCAILVFHIQLLPLFKNIHAVHIYFLFVASYQKVAVLIYI